VGVGEGEVLLVDEEAFVGISLPRDDERLAWVYTDDCESTDIFLSAVALMLRCKSIPARESMLGGK